MSDSLWRKVSYLFGLLGIFILFGLVVFCANVEIKDLDLWLHLGMGKFITQYKYVPDVDVLSCTIAGQPWVNHEWLFQVIVYLINFHFGPEGLISMQVMVVALTFLVLLLLGYNREKQFSVTFILLLVMMVYQLRFTIRPDIFSLLFFALYIYILALHLEKKWALYALVITQILWANMHGFFFFGPFIISVGILAEFIRRRVKLPWQWNESGRLTDAEYGNLKRILFFVILACFINPLTFRGVWYPIDVLIHLPGKSSVFFSVIQELKPPITSATIFSTEPYPHYRILIMLSFFSFIFNRRNIDIGDLFIWLVFFPVSLMAQRNIVFFAFVAYLVCMTNFGNLSSEDLIPIYFKDKKFKYITICILKVVLIVWMLQYGSSISTRGYFDFDKFEMKSEFGGLTQRYYPNKAADFLVNNKIKGNFFNDFNSGAYLIGRAYPDIKVFIDGRTEVYGPKFFKYYEKIWAEADVETFKDAIKRYKLTGVFLHSVHEAIPPKILSYIYKQPEWVLVYFDYDGMIFLKDIPENKIWINQFRLNLAKRKVPKMDLKRLGPRTAVPFQYINRAYSLENMDLDDAALEEIAEAKKMLPSYSSSYKIAGKIYGKKKDFKKAFENFRIAAMTVPEDIEVRSNLALAYDKLGDFEHAIKQYNAIVSNKPKDPKAYFLLAKVYVKNGQFDNAFSTLRQGYRLDTRAVGDLFEVGDILFKKGNFGFAKKIYEIPLLEKKDLAKVHNKIGLCYLSMKQKEAARKEFEKGLALDPKDADLKKNFDALEVSVSK